VRLQRLALLSALAWMAIIFYLSHQPALEAPMLFPGQDKLFHAIAYGLLAALFLAAGRLPASGYGRREVAISVLLASLYGISDEFHQSFISGRSSELLDWLADTGGALLAALLVAALSRALRRRTRAT
jgi:VanZ family protein